MAVVTLPDKTLPQMLREQAARQPGRIAIRQKDFGIWQPLSWSDYLRRASHVGLGLAALGLERGGHLGVISENRVEWVLAQMGAGLVGAVTVGVYPTSPSNEVAYVVGHADVEIVADLIGAHAGAVDGCRKPAAHVLRPAGGHRHAAAAGRVPTAG